MTNTRPGLLALLLPLALCIACSNQGEGERCDLENGNIDCESGLVCKSLQSLTGSGEGGICCPDENNPTEAACRPGSLDIGEDDDSDPMDDETGADASADDNDGQTTDAAAPDAATSDASTSDAATVDAAATPSPDAGDAAADSGAN